MRKYLDDPSLKEKKITNYINSFTDKNAKGYCDNCFKENIARANKNYLSIKKEIITAFSEYLIEIPVLTIEVVPKWDFRVIELVSTTLSTKPTNKRKEAEEKESINALRKKTFELGGNAIIGTRIIYSFGDSSNKSYSGILSVYGTAIEVENINLFSKRFHKAKEKYNQYIDLQKLVNKYASFH